MAATFSWGEDNGTQTGSPLKGTTRNTSRTERNYKNIDDSTTAYSSSPITAGNNSFSKYQFGNFTGTYNQILNGKWSAHTSPAGALATGLTLKGTVTSTYATPSTTTNAALSTDFTTAIAVGGGSALTVLFSTTGPEGSSTNTSLSSGGGYTQYLVTQLQTTTSAAAGDISSITETLQYDEN
jgi:hypothetical protein